MHVVVNCTVRREGEAVSATSILFDDQGQRLAASDKQVLIGHENDFLRRATAVCPVVETRLGRIGLYACMDGVICETPRSLALRGADILCNSLNSFALDEARLHVPVRAAENHVFVVAANKCGPLIPEALLEPVSAATSIPVRFLNGAGESQIVAPDGRVLTMAPREGQAVVLADIDPRQARDKASPRRNRSLHARRPELYAVISVDPARHALEHHAAARLDVAVVTPRAKGAARGIGSRGARRAVSADGVECGAARSSFASKGRGQRPQPRPRTFAARHRRARGGTGAGPASSHRFVTHDGGNHRLSGASSAVARGCNGRSQCRTAVNGTLGDAGRRQLRTLDLPWGRLAVLPGADSISPEAARMAAIAGAEVLVVPFAPQESWELATGPSERSPRIDRALSRRRRRARSRKPFITTLEEDFTVMSAVEESAVRRFALLSHRHACGRRTHPGVLRATVHSARARNKVVSHRTDLVAGRPWQLAQGITKRAYHG
jgi:predicted amidohydrolase